MLKKIYRKLLKEQKERGVIFSSTLSLYMYETEDSKRHEVFKLNDEDYKDKPAYERIDAYRKQCVHIKRLKDDKFFNDSSFNYNIIRSG